MVEPTTRRWQQQQQQTVEPTTRTARQVRLIERDARKSTVGLWIDRSTTKSTFLYVRSIDLGTFC